MLQRSMLLEAKTSREFLNVYLEWRRTANPRYSMRALALALGVSPPALWNMLKGKRGFSHARLLGIAEKLKLTATERKHLTLLAELEDQAASTPKETTLKRISRNRNFVRTLNVPIEKTEEFLLWDLFVLIECFHLTNVPPNARELAELSGLPPERVHTLIGRLLKLGIVEEEADGRYRKVVGSVIGESAVDRSDFKKIHLEGLRQASEAVGRVPAARRYSVTEMVTLEPGLVGEAKKIVDDALNELHTLQAKSRGAKAIYSVCLHLFPAIEKTP